MCIFVGFDDFQFIFVFHSLYKHSNFFLEMDGGYSIKKLATAFVEGKLLSFFMIYLSCFHDIFELIIIFYRLFYI